MRQGFSKMAKNGGFSVYPVETHGATLGIADLLFAGRGEGGVIELKIAEGKGAAKIPYRSGQRMFLREHARKNPRTYVLCYWPSHDAYFLIDQRDGFPPSYGTGSASLPLKARWAGKVMDESLLDAIVSPVVE